MRTSHASHPIWIPAKRPKTARAYRYGPPASRKRDATSAKQAMMAAMPAAATRYAQGLAVPRCLAITAGRPNTPLAIMVFNTSAARLQRPMARTSCAAPDTKRPAYRGGGRPRHAATCTRDRLRLVQIGATTFFIAPGHASMARSGAPPDPAPSARHREAEREQRGRARLRHDGARDDAG